MNNNAFVSVAQFFLLAAMFVGLAAFAIWAATWGLARVVDCWTDYSESALKIKRDRDTLERMISRLEADQQNFIESSALTYLVHNYLSVLKPRDGKSFKRVLYSVVSNDSKNVFDKTMCMLGKEQELIKRKSEKEQKRIEALDTVLKDLDAKGTS